MIRTAASNLRPATAAAITEAAGILRRGGLVAFPTETVYGLGANARDERAVASIFEAKGRPRFNPLIVHVASLADAEQLADFPIAARKMATAFWPGPLTLVLRRKPNSGLSLLVSAGLDTVALRVPAHTIAQQLFAASGVPVAAPSANASGSISATTGAHVLDSLGDRVDLILDDGAAQVGIESTIIGFENGRATLLRSGALSRDAIETIAGTPLAGRKNAISSPGQMESHYAPRATLRLDARNVLPDEALLAFGPNIPRGAKTALNLSPSGDLTEAAANLFAMLRSLDSESGSIAVMPIPETGLGEAINDRLRRAAAPRVTT